MRHKIKRAVLEYIQKENLTKLPLGGNFYKFFIVLSKDRVWEFEKKIANLSKKDTIKHTQEEFKKARKECSIKLSSTKV